MRVVTQICELPNLYRFSVSCITIIVIPQAAQGA